MSYPTYPYQYATVEEVRGRYDGDFVDRICLNSETREPDDARLQASLLDATEEIDSYLSAVYQVPIIPCPGLLKRMCMDMAIYHTAITADKMTEELAMRYKGWITHLMAIANRKVGLGVAVGQTGTDASGNAVVAAAPTVGTGSSAASSGRTIRV